MKQCGTGECRAAWKRADGALYVIAANPLREAQTFSITLPRPVGGDGRVLFTDESTVKVTSGVLTDRLEPLGVRMYRWGVPMSSGG